MVEVAAGTAEVDGAGMVEEAGAGTGAAGAGDRASPSDLAYHPSTMLLHQRPTTRRRLTIRTRLTTDTAAIRILQVTPMDTLPAPNRATSIRALTPITTVHQTNQSPVLGGRDDPA